MRVASIKIRNLRSIDELVVELPHDLTTIVGSNSSGKSNLFRGFELFFNDTIDRRNFNALFDMPAWIINSTAPQARTSIQIEFEFSDAGDDVLWKEVEKYRSAKNFPETEARHFTLIKYYSRSNSSGFQSTFPGRGVRDTEGKELTELAEKIIKKIDYRYVPSLKDFQSDSFRAVSEELKTRLLSIWAGGDRAEVKEKREKFQGIRKEIEQLIQDSASGLSTSLHTNFPEVTSIKLAMASTELEDMIGNLDIFANDGHETLMRQKGSGVQGVSIIHTLRALRQTAPKSKHQKRLFLWNIEEPETFLHPNAQRRLFGLLQEQAKNTQILLTTHSPIFIDRKNPKSNVLFRREKKGDNFITQRIKLPSEDSLKPIRESLGTSLADSLALHEVVIIVEGLSDVTVFKRAFERLCEGKVLNCEKDFVGFISGHGASQQATGFSILKSWSPLSRLVAIFDWDKAGRDDGAKRLRGRAAAEKTDFFYIPHATGDVVLEDLYPPRILTSAQTNNSIVQTITIQQRPNGEQIGEKQIEWNKDQLAQYFCSNATDAEWKPIENFVKEVVETTLRPIQQHLI